MSEYIVGRTANDVWKKAVNKILQMENTLEGRTGDVYEILHTFITVENPRQKWIYERMPPISIGYALAELVWIVNGDDRADVINTWNPNLPKYAGTGDVYYGAYGKRIRAHFGFDQMEKAYNALQSVPESRQVVIQIYDTKYDFPIEKGQPRNLDIPCNICSMLKVRQGRLEWSQIMRSNDILLGMPYNFVQFTGLQEILAGWLGLEVGLYNHYSDSLHLYSRDKNKVGIDKVDEIENNDSLSLDKRESERIFKEIYGRMECLAKESISEREIEKLANLDSGLIEYNNIMYVIAAYIAFKKDHGLSKQIMSRCTNDLYVMIWNKWVDKMTI